MLAAAEIADLGLEGRDARGDLAADLAHAIDADAAAGIARLRAHQRRRLCGRPVAAAHIFIRRQQAPRHGQHRGHRQIGHRGGVRRRTMADRDPALACCGKIDAVIAGAIADDRAELRQLVHHGRAERRSARRDHRPDAGELVGLEHLVRRFARGVHQFEALPDAHHHRLGKARIDQDLVRHRLIFLMSKKRGGIGCPIPPLVHFTRFSKA